MRSLLTLTFLLRRKWRRLSQSYQGRWQIICIILVKTAICTLTHASMHPPPPRHTYTHSIKGHSRCFRFAQICAAGICAGCRQTLVEALSPRGHPPKVHRCSLLPRACLLDSVISIPVLAVGLWLDWSQTSLHSADWPALCRVHLQVSHKEKVTKRKPTTQILLLCVFWLNIFKNWTVLTNFYTNLGFKLHLKINRKTC